MENTREILEKRGENLILIDSNTDFVSLKFFVQ